MYFVHSDNTFTSVFVHNNCEELNRQIRDTNTSVKNMTELPQKIKKIKCIFLYRKLKFFI